MKIVSSEYLQNMLSTQVVVFVFNSTIKSLSEALIFASTNPQYEDNLFIDLKVQYIEFQAQTWGEHVVYRNCF